MANLIEKCFFNIVGTVTTTAGAKEKMGLWRVPLRPPSGIHLLTPLEVKDPNLSKLWASERVQHLQEVERTTPPPLGLCRTSVNVSVLICARAESDLAFPDGGLVSIGPGDLCCSSIKRRSLRRSRPRPPGIRRARRKRLRPERDGRRGVLFPSGQEI